MYHYHWAWTNLTGDISWPAMTIAVLGTLALVQSAVLLNVARLSRRALRSEDRLERLNEVLTLLTETSESGFRAVAAEVERLSTPAASRRGAKASTSRVTRAARQGQKISDIAAAEGISQGEVRLRLHLADPALLERTDAQAAQA